MLEARENHPCSYLPELEATTQYRWIEDCDAETYQQMLERGWRRFGCTFFRPHCAHCSECRSLRVPVATFQPDRSMRRVFQKNRDLEIFLGPPSLSLEHLDLFGRYHAARSSERGWSPRETTPQDYFLSFVDGAHEFGAELQLRLHEKLAAVALLDILPRGLSAIYCYYDPSLKERSLGTMAILAEMEIARRRNIPQLFLGYWVEPNASMRYKARFKPHQLLTDRPDDAEPARWRLPVLGGPEEGASGDQERKEE